MTQICNDGISMTVAKSRVDENGRVYIPSDIREQLSLVEGSIVDIEVEDDHAVLAKGKSVAEEAWGIFSKGRDIPDVDKALDEALEERVKKWIT